jgi:hypothetical protein
MNEPLMATTISDSKISKPQKSDLNTTGLATTLLNLGGRKKEGHKQDGPGSRVKFVKFTKDMETETDQESEIQEKVEQTWIPMDHMDTRT